MATLSPPGIYQYFLSNSALIASYLFLKTRATGRAHGFPSVKVRIFSLTASAYNTVVGSGRLTVSAPETSLLPSTSAVPGSTITAPAATPTTIAPASSSVTTTSSRLILLHLRTHLWDSLLSLQRPAQANYIKYAWDSCKSLKRMAAVSASLIKSRQRYSTFVSPS